MPLDLRRFAGWQRVLRRRRFSLACGVDSRSRPTGGFAFAWLLGAIALSASGFAVEQPGDSRPGNAISVSPPAAAIAALGDDSYRVRRAAEMRLLALGEAARGELTATAEGHGDPEIRRRSRRLIAALDEIRLRAYRASLEERLADFIDDDRAGELDYEFPGWKAYRATIGHDRAARELFAQMQREEPELLAQCDGDAKVLAREFSARVVRIGQSLSHPLPHFRETITPARAAALYFAASNKELTLDTRVGSQLYSLSSQATVRTALADAEKGRYLRKVLGNWVALDQGGDRNLAYYKVLAAMQHNLPEGRQAGLNLIKDDKAPGTSYQFMQGLMAIARFGTAEDVETIEPLLANNTVCQTVTMNRVKYTTQIRDVALVALIQLTGQDHKEYGFDRLQKNPRTVFATQTHTMGFPSDDGAARDEAINKWRRWRASQKKSERKADK